MTPQYLETLDEDAEFSDDDDPGATATERARAALQRRPQRDEEEEVRAAASDGCQNAASYPLSISSDSA